MSKIYLILFCFLFTVLTYSQNTKEDSLLRLVSREQQDTTRFNLYFSLTKLMLNTEDKDRYVDSLNAIASRTDIPLLRVKALSQKGLSFFEKGENQKALNLFFKSLEICKKENNKKFTSKLYNNIANCYDVMGIYEKALYFHFEALKIKEELGLKDKIYISRINIATVYYNLKQYKQAIDYCNLALVDCIKYGDKENEAIIYHNLGNNYHDLKEYDKGIDYYNKSLEISKADNDYYQFTNTTIELGSSYLFLNKIDLAEKTVNTGLKVAEENDFTEHISGGKNILGQIAVKRSNYNLAKKYYFEALDIAKKNDIILQVKNSYENLSNVFAQQNDFKESLKYQLLFSNIKDSLINDSKAKSMANLQENYEIDKKETENALLQAENKLSSSTIKQQKIVTYFIVGGLLIVSLLAFFIFKGLKVQKRANAIIVKQKKEVEIQKHKVEEHQKEILDSIHYAKRIQTALLANKELIDANTAHNFVLFNPKDIVSGDFYWATEHNQKFYLAVCDSTGHGVPGAFMSLLNIGFLSEAIKEKNIEKPNEIFNYVRKRLISSISNEGQKDGMDGILICIDKQTNNITYAAANNEPVLISGTDIILLPKDRMPVGKGEKANEFKLFEIPYHPNATIYLYTDGYADQFGGAKGKKFKYKQLEELLLSVSALPMQEQMAILNQTFENWRGNLEQVDDVLIIGIKI
ncbi:MAG: tetratricopeptide repeat protein [Bacteroidetes bacterium]|nr:tetratricopeptide repeat protein [Bacteroidota bacterium]